MQCAGRLPPSKPLTTMMISTQLPHTTPQAGLPAFAAVDLPTCCAILELLYSGGSPYQAVLSRGGRLMAGGRRLGECEGGGVEEAPLQRTLQHLAAPELLSYCHLPTHHPPGAVLAAALCIAAPPAAVAAQPAAIELLADATGFPAEVLRSQAANILSFVLRSS